jgi:small GTP-binding protein
MGVWQRSSMSRQIAREHPSLTAGFREALPDFEPADVAGSPFAVYAHEVDENLGGNHGLAVLRDRLDQLGLRLVLDFVPNHVAVDHPWISEFPERIIRGTETDLSSRPKDFFQTNSGMIFAHGRDPYFPGWTDTAQLDYRRKETRVAMSVELQRIAELCDGVRCDMAMLVTRQVFQQTWGGDFDDPKEEFWPATIAHAKEVNPNFILIAEVYWDMEYQLQQMGFDYTYDKRLYDFLQDDNAGAVTGHLHADHSYQDHMVRFIENHDERRAAQSLGQHRSCAAATLALGLPGMRLFHDGQLEGRCIKSPVQLRRWTPEPLNESIAQYYRRLIASLSDPIFHDGQWSLLEPRAAAEGNTSYHCFIAYRWVLDNERRVIVVNLNSHPAQCFLPLGFENLGGQNWLLRDLLHANSHTDYVRNGDKLLEQGLYLDVPAHGYHLFDIKPCLEKVEKKPLAGINQRAKLRQLGGASPIFAMAWSPDGEFILGAGVDRVIEIWDVAKETQIDQLPEHPDIVTCLAWSPDGRLVASGSNDRKVRIWDMAKRELRRELNQHRDNVLTLAWSPDGKWLASGGADHVVCVWDAHNLKLVQELAGHTDAINSLAWSGDGKILASGSGDRKVLLWGVPTWIGYTRVLNEQDWISSIAWSADSELLAAGTGGGNIGIWDPKTGRKLASCEGHTQRVLGVAFAPDGSVFVSKSADGTVRFWNRHSWNNLGPPLLENGQYVGGVVFQREKSVFATRDDAANSITIWDLDTNKLLQTTSAESQIRYSSAKVVLLGESNVGKTALAFRIATEDRFEGQTTTHGMRIWKLPPEKLDPDSAAPPGERREVVLWDLGGQDEYRLIHQLFIHDTELALMLFDPTRGKTELEEVLGWNVRLKAQRRGQKTTKLLIGSKLDYGDAAVDRTAVDHLLTACEAKAFLPTSAKTGFGVPELKKELARNIDWSTLTQTSRPVLFQYVRDKIDHCAANGDVTLQLADLRALIQRSYPDEYSEAAVDQVVNQLARQGVIADTHLASGERMLVLKIEEIERYAGSLIFSAKEKLRTRGVPMLDEAEIIRPDIEFPRIPREARLLPSRERVVLECVVELLIERGICLRQPGLLVFPSLFPEVQEESTALTESVSLYYDFTGPIDNLYAALIAEAALAERFGRVRVSARRAELESPEHGLCGLRLKKAQRSGRGHLEIFFSEQTGSETRALFREFVADFLERNGVSVTKAMEVRCLECDYQFSEADVRSQYDAEEEKIYCPKGHCTRISEAVMRTRETSPEVKDALVALRTDIDDHAKLSTAKAKRAMGLVRIFVSYAHADDGLRAELSKHLSELKREGVAVWDDREIGPGAEWSAAIDERLEDAEIVLLLLSADFMASHYCRLEADRALKRHAKGEATVIPVVLRPVDWTTSEFGRLQALPQEGKAVTQWPSRDDAFVDVARGLHRTVKAILRTPSVEEEAEVTATHEVTIVAPQPSLRILHLSDLHFSQDTDPIEFYQPLARDIQNPNGELGFSKLDYLVISGDLTRHAQPGEFERVHQFLDRLFDSFGLSPERTLIVPGNHDLSWETDVYRWLPERKVDEGKLEAGNWIKQGNGYLVRNDSRYGARFENFARFYKERMQQDYPLAAENQGQVLLTERNQIQLIGLNSAWEVDEYFPNRSSIHLGALERALGAANRQTAAAMNEGRLTAEADLLRIAVWHHPPTGSEKIHEDAFLDRLRDANVSLCLHGHVHEDRAELVRYTNPRKLYVAGAGSFGAVAEDRPESTPRLYNLVEIPHDRSLIRIHTRSMRKHGGAWEGWAIWPGERKDERRTFYEIQLIG